MPQAPDDYTSYLLRLWKSNMEGKPTWRVSLECVRTGQQLNFPNLDGLIACLLKWCGQIECEAERAEPEKQKAKQSE